jgi:hypothetical protein
MVAEIYVKFCKQNWFFDLKLYLYFEIFTIHFAIASYPDSMPSYLEEGGKIRPKLSTSRSYM